MNTLSKLTRQVCRLTLLNQFNDVGVVAPRLVYTFDHVYVAAASQNYFARSLTLSSIIHGSKKDINNPGKDFLLLFPRKKYAKYATGFSAEDDKKIMEYVKKYGKELETWKKLADIFGKKSYTEIRNHYEFYLERTPTVKGKFSEKEDQLILSYVEKNGKGLNSISDLTKQLDRGSPKSVKDRHEKLVSNNVRNFKKWELFEEEELMKALSNIKEINPRDWTSLETAVTSDFNEVSQKLQRTKGSCYKHWKVILLPILKTHLKGLPLSPEWKKDFRLYIIKHKIRHYKELDLGFIVDEVCPGQTSKSISYYANYVQQIPKNIKNLPLYEIMKIKMNVKAPNSLVFNSKKMEKDLQRKNDIVDLYKSII